MRFDFVFMILDCLTCSVPIYPALSCSLYVVNVAMGEERFFAQVGGRYERRDSRHPHRSMFNVISISSTGTAAWICESCLWLA